MNRLAGFFLIFLISCLCGAATIAQDDERPKKPTRRYGFEVDEFTYPQKTPKEAMKSIAFALDRKKMEYMLAQLVDPDYVDYWVDRFKKDFVRGREEAKTLLAFDRLVHETNQYYRKDPLIQKDLRVFAKKADWSEEGNVAVGTVLAIPARKVFLRRIDERWFLENRQQDSPTVQK
jgi:hypothetical protein